MEPNIEIYTIKVFETFDWPPAYTNHYCTNCKQHIILRDGCNSHLIHDIFDFCSTKNIHLICLPLHATHIINHKILGCSVSVPTAIALNRNFGFEKNNMHLAKDSFICKPIWYATPNSTL
jgi:hypothetical protein